ncbi:MAG: DNA primase regulatory subunit PriL [Methanospirillum sp.]|nr:DNA primase regulatory subunit PriL [Methanospirillum sp.]
MAPLDKKDLAKYPFLRESQAYIGTVISSLEEFLKSPKGRIAVHEAMQTLENALSFNEKNPPSLPEIPADAYEIPYFIAVYPVSRILVSCAQDRALIDRLVRYQSWLFYSYLQKEDPGVEIIIRREIGLPEGGNSIPVIDYVPIASRLGEDHWRLINRVVVRGQVQVNPLEYDRVIRERLRYVMAQQLPLKVPSRICDLVKPAVERIQAAWQKRILEEFGSVEESAFPPCIQAILQAIAGNGHLTHMARFAVTAFLHNIGMDTTHIVELYGNTPHFDLRKTMYQVEHISGRGGTGNDYTSPLCATMKTHGICVHPDSTCGRINHPLSYYKIKKKEKKQNGKDTKTGRDTSADLRQDDPGPSQSGGHSPDSVAPGADDRNKDEKRSKISGMARQEFRKDENKSE